MPTRIESIERSLRQSQPSWVHISNYGHAYNQVLNPETGLPPRPMSPTTLQMVFKEWAKNVTGVVLSGCAQESQMVALAEVVPYVVGIQPGIDPQAHIAFVCLFYRSLMRGKPVHVAFHLAVEALQGRDRYVPLPRLYRNGELIG